MLDTSDNRRKSERVIYDVIIRCSKAIFAGQLISYDSPLEMQVVNISNEGLCVASSEVFSKGAILEFSIVLEDSVYEDLSGTVIWTINEDNLNKYGLHFNRTAVKFVEHVNLIENKLAMSLTV